MADKKSLKRLLSAQRSSKQEKENVIKKNNFHFKNIKNRFFQINILICRKKEASLSKEREAFLSRLKILLSHSITIHSYLILFISRYNKNFYFRIRTGHQPLCSYKLLIYFLIKIDTYTF